MFAQFQARYPVSSLISELLTIHQGRFVVRVSAQVEGVTRATGMATAETIELAEDQARSRALMVLGIQPEISANSVASPPQNAVLQVQAVETAFESNDLADSSSPASPGEELRSDNMAVFPGFKENDAYSKDFSQRPVTSTSQVPASDAVVENFGLMSGSESGSSSSPPISFNNATPLVQRSYSQDAEAPRRQIGAETAQAISEPIDLSDAIARTTVEIKRLRWSNQQGREYLVRTYSKRSRQELTDEQMLEFLHYLESQPSP